MDTNGKIILGATCGVISGAALLGLTAYFAKETGFIPSRAVAPYAAIAGCIYGIIPGIAIGFLAAKFQTNKLIGALVGAGVGSSFVVLFFVFGNDVSSDEEMFNMALACIPIGAVVGLIVSATNTRHGQKS